MCDINALRMDKVTEREERRGRRRERRGGEGKTGYSFKGIGRLLPGLHGSLLL